MGRGAPEIRGGRRDSIRAARLDRAGGGTAKIGSPGWGQANVRQGARRFVGCRGVECGLHLLPRLVQLSETDERGCGAQIPRRIVRAQRDDVFVAVKGDIDAWLPRVVPGGVLVFDDYFGTKPTWGVRQAVDELLASGAVRPTLARVGTHVWTVKL